jgi:hypothetical protein
MKLKSVDKRGKRLEVSLFGGWLGILLLTLALTACQIEPTQTSGSGIGKSGQVPVAASPTPPAQVASTPNAGSGASNNPNARPTQAEPGLPVLTGFRAVTVGKTLDDTMIGILKDAAPAARYRVYFGKATAAQVSAFYDSQLPGRGYSRLFQDVNTNNGLKTNINTSGYLKTGAGFEGAVVLVIGPLEESTMGWLPYIDPTFGKDIKVGDTVLILAAGELAKR